jgi:hypothetical protein
MSYDVNARSTVVFGGQAAGTLFGDAWHWNGITWQSVAGPGPGPAPSAASAFAFDQARGAHVLFTSRSSGGSFQPATWVLTGQSWFEAVTMATPSVRLGASLVYVDNLAVCLLFGGSNPNTLLSLNDVWTYDGLGWNLVNPTSPPPPRTGHGMAWDANRGRVVVFGGMDSLTGAVNGETWELDPVTLVWTQVMTATVPPPRRDAGLAYDTRRRVCVLHGGADTNLLPLNDTWEYDGTDWTPVTAAPPPARSGAGLVYDAARGVLVSFGGDPFPLVALPPIDAVWEYSPGPRLRIRQPGGPGSGVMLDINDLTPGAECFSLFSTTPCPAGVGRGPFFGLCTNDFNLLVTQVLTPLGSVPFHYLAPAAAVSFGPYVLAPTYIEGVAFELVNGGIGAVSAVFPFMIQ